MELPPPPSRNGYGGVQREVARKHGVALIPKRHFARILAAPGAESDPGCWGSSLHSSSVMHQLRPVRPTIGAAPDRGRRRPSPG